MIKKILDPYKVFISLLIAAAFWLAPIGVDVETISVDGLRMPLNEYSPFPKLIQVIAPQAFAACANNCKESVCLRWVPIGGSCHPSNPWDIGCCTRYGTVCNDQLPGCGPVDPPPPPPPSYSPPSASAALTCAAWGNSAWCINNGKVVISASDPQGFAVTISGSITLNGSSTPFSCANPCDLSMPSGSGTVSYSAVAATSGLSSATGSIAFYFDTGNPVITSSTSGAQSGSWHISVGATVTVLSSDSISGLASVSITRNGTVVTSPFSLADGTHNISVIATDVAGNQSASSFTVKVDSVKPQITFDTTGLLNGAWYRSATVAVGAADATSGVQSLLITDNGFAKSSPIALFDGAHTIFATATDNAGNVQAASLNLQVDGTPPTIVPNITGTSGSNGWYISDVQVSASAADAGSGLDIFMISVDGNAWQDYSAPISLSDGLHTVQFQAADIAGNSAAANISVDVDTIAPQVISSITGSTGTNGWYVSGVTVQAANTDSTSAIASEKYRLDGGAWQNGSSITVSQDGLHTVDFLVIDNAGNQTTISRSFKIDQAPPQITLTPAGVSRNSGWYVSSVSLEMLSNDTTSGLSSAEYNLDETGWKLLLNSITLTDGRHIIQSRSRDYAGNLSTTSIAINVDTTSPALTLVLIGTTGENNWYVSDVLADVSTSDATSGNVVTTITDNGGLKNFDPITLTEGIHNLHYTTVDAAGNSVSASAVVSVDTSIPTTILSSPSPNSVAIDVVQISGQSADLTSGVFTHQISFDNVNWLSLPRADPDWSYDWETVDLPNGALSIFARSIDQAGNIGIPAQTYVVLDNHPPFLKLSSSWNIWESGSLSVQPNITPLKSVRIVVHDSLQRYADEVIYFDLPAPKQITWDRVIGPGNAPPGSYPVEVEVCDIYDLCSKATATIIIPQGDLISLLEPLIFHIPFIRPPVLAPPIQIVIPIQPPQVVVTPPEIQPVVVPLHAPVWPAAFVSTLLLMFAILLSLDPRPSALRSLTKTIQGVIHYDR